MRGSTAKPLPSSCRTSSTPDAPPTRPRRDPGPVRRPPHDDPLRRTPSRSTRPADAPVRRGRLRDRIDATDLRAGAARQRRPARWSWRRRGAWGFVRFIVFALVLAAIVLVVSLDRAATAHQRRRGVLGRRQSCRAAVPVRRRHRARRPRRPPHDGGLDRSDPGRVHGERGRHRVDHREAAPGRGLPARLARLRLPRQRAMA